VLPFRPHVLGIDDGPFDRHRAARVPVVGVMTEGHDLVEAVAVTDLPVDAEDVTARLADWVLALRFGDALHAVVLGGVTIAGLAIVDISELSRRLSLPVLVVNRRDPRDDRLISALTLAGLAARIPIVERTPRAWQVDAGLFVAQAGAEQAEAERILGAIRGKSRLPEPLRLAHLIGAALVRGQSRGRP
jgi:endonuclease V-like protein UPF0215 family